MTTTFIPGRVLGTGVEITDALSDPDDAVLLVETKRIDDADPAFDLEGATTLRNVLHLAVTRGRTNEAASRFDRPIRIRIDRGDYIRASGAAICLVCGCSFLEHTEARGFPTLNILCDGRLVKL